jgi:hypothetical protein
MKLYLTGTFFILGLLTYGIYISQIELSVVPKELNREGVLGFYDYRGVINVRTNLSSGSSSPQEVSQAAKAAGLDFLILTDQNQFNIFEPTEIYNSNLLVLRENEFRFLDSRIFLLGFPGANRPSGPGDVQIQLADLLSQRNTEKRDHLVLLAHPFNPKETWTGAYPPGLNGLEVLNARAISQKAWIKSKPSVLWSIFLYPFNPRYAFLRLYSDPVNELRLWDQLSQDRSIIAFAGPDASARSFPFSDYLVKFPSYQKSFELMSNHLLLSSELTGNPQRDKQKLLQALQEGQFYFALDLLGDPKGFFSYVQDEQKTYPIGSRLNLKKGLRLIVQLPAVPEDFYEIVIFKNGQRVFVGNDPVIRFNLTEPGVYRAVVRVRVNLPFPENPKWFSWIFTNNFYID